jgi:hypothetical protein
MAISAAEAAPMLRIAAVASAVEIINFEYFKVIPQDVAENLGVF